MNKTLWPIDKLVNWKRNPRTISEESKARLKKQLLKLKQYKPLLITIEDGVGIVLGGNMRLMCMRELAQAGNLDFKQVWVSIVNAPDDKTKLEYALSDNDSAGKYDETALVGMVAEIPSFDMEGYHIETGYSMDLNELVDKYKETKEDEFDAEAEASKINIPVSSIGSVYELGEHRLMCGSATDLDHIKTLMGGGTGRYVFYRPTVQC